jgi:predicted dehydrogenase
MVQMAHLPHLLQIHGVRPTAIADVDVEAARRLAAVYNIPKVYASSQAMVDGEPELDGVIVVTPRMHHAEACLPILKRGIPVFMEKPLEVTIEKGRQIVEANSARSITLRYIALGDSGGPERTCLARYRWMKIHYRLALHRRQRPARARPTRLN